MARLLVIDGRGPEVIEVPRGVLVDAVIEAMTLLDELDEDLEAVTQRVFGGHRMGAVAKVQEIQARAFERRQAFALLAGIAEAAPACPDGVAAIGHGKAA